MIVLDTNVVSECARRTPDEQVMRWLDRLDPDRVAVTSTTVAELLYGISRLPDSQRRTSIAAAVEEILDSRFGGRSLPFDHLSAACYGPLAAARSARGRPISVGDAQIAAICLAVGATLATRNVRDFEGTGIDVIDPWAAS